LKYFNQSKQHGIKHAKHAYKQNRPIMENSLRILLWNANGLSNHKLELQNFLQIHKINIVLIFLAAKQPKRHFHHFSF
jgi:hypothetical protein